MALAMITIVVKIKTTTRSGTGVVNITISVRNNAGTAKRICHIVEMIRVALYLKTPSRSAGMKMQIEKPKAIHISTGRSKLGKRPTTQNLVPDEYKPKSKNKAEK